MSIQVFQNIKDAISNLDPEDIRRHTERPVRFFLYANRERDYRAMEQFLVPSNLSPAKRAEVLRLIYRASEGNAPSAASDLEIFYGEPGEAADSGSPKVFTFDPARPDATVNAILHQRPDLAVPLAVHAMPFRQEVSHRMVKKVAKENALFALATAVPDIIPFLTLPWAAGEFASDTAVLTANQIRLAFLLAAANDRDVGYREQRAEIGTIILGAFGWRALARELVGMIPWGAGLIPKAAIAYAGTRVAGMSLERYYRLGKAYTRAERRAAYDDALHRGRRLVGEIMEGFQQRNRRQG
jgi:hypothetical protein